MIELFVQAESSKRLWAAPDAGTSDATGDAGFKEFLLKSQRDLTKERGHHHLATKRSIRYKGLGPGETTKMLAKHLALPTDVAELATWLLAENPENRISAQKIHERLGHRKSKATSKSSGRAKGKSAEPEWDWTVTKPTVFFEVPDVPAGRAAGILSAPAYEPAELDNRDDGFSDDDDGFSEDDDVVDDC